MVAVVATVTEQGLVVVVLVPVEGFDLEAAALRVTADDARHGLVHETRGPLEGHRAQVLDLLAKVPPAVHTGQLGGGGVGETGMEEGREWGREREICFMLIFQCLFDFICYLIFYIHYEGVLLVCVSLLS